MIKGGNMALHMKQVILLFFSWLTPSFTLQAQIILFQSKPELAIDSTAFNVQRSFKLVHYVPFEFLRKQDSIIRLGKKWIETDREATPISFIPEGAKASFWQSTAEVSEGFGLFLAILFFSPVQATKWDHKFGRELMEHAGTRFKEAWTSPPVWDKDKLFTNYVSHPYAGSFYYNTIRIKGRPAAASFRFSVFSSTLWEYVPEAFFEQPSIQDLIITPIAGSIGGEAVHRLTLSLSTHGFTFWEKVLVFILNPAYVLNHGFKVPTNVQRIRLRQMR
jgi:hypothetical protein